MLGFENMLFVRGMRKQQASECCRRFANEVRAILCFGVPRLSVSSTLGPKRAMHTHTHTHKERNARTHARTRSAERAHTGGERS
mmetsp:Transcript_18911/g.43881  ORF Transcript_18911/g.43881 Transcript_18911/m.43881 type:complete len:84 (-) Transcript_18911:185-436(-)